MKTLKITFTVPEDLVHEFETRIPRGKRRAFIADAIRARFTEIEQAQRMRELMESMSGFGHENLELDTETDSIATLEDMEDDFSDLT